MTLIQQLGHRFEFDVGGSEFNGFTEMIRLGYELVLFARSRRAVSRLTCASWIALGLRGWNCAWLARDVARGLRVRVVPQLGRGTPPMSLFGFSYLLFLCSGVTPGGVRWFLDSWLFPPGRLGSRVRVPTLTRSPSASPAARIESEGSHSYTISFS